MVFRGIHLGVMICEEMWTDAAAKQLRQQGAHFLLVINSRQLKAYPDAGGGSGDFANLKDVDGFIELPAEVTDFKAGQVFRYFPFRS